jgi:hypothetical protein
LGCYILHLIGECSTTLRSTGAKGENSESTTDKPAKIKTKVRPFHRRVGTDLISIKPRTVHPSAHANTCMRRLGSAGRLEQDYERELEFQQEGLVASWEASLGKKERVSQMLPISATKSSNSFFVSWYFFMISSYLVSHWAFDCSRAWTLRS